MPQHKKCNLEWAKNPAQETLKHYASQETKDEMQP